MNLKQWLSRENLTSSAFADQLGESRQVVHNWLTKKHLPSLTKAYKVRSATNGAVDFTDWLPAKRAAADKQRSAGKGSLSLRG